MKVNTYLFNYSSSWSWKLLIIDHVVKTNSNFHTFLYHITITFGFTKTCTTPLLRPILYTVFSQILANASLTLEKLVNPLLIIYTINIVIIIHYEIKMEFFYKSKSGQHSATNYSKLWNHFKLCLSYSWWLIFKEETNSARCAIYGGDYTANYKSCPNFKSTYKPHKIKHPTQKSNIHTPCIFLISRFASTKSKPSLFINFLNFWS